MRINEDGLLFIRTPGQVSDLSKPCNSADEPDAQIRHSADEPNADYDFDEKIHWTIIAEKARRLHGGQLFDKIRTICEGGTVV